MTKINETTTPKTNVPQKAGNSGNPDKHSQHQQAPKIAPDKAKPADHSQHDHPEHAGKK